MSAQKGQRKKVNNRYASMIETLNLETGLTRAVLREDYDYINMTFSKSPNLLVGGKLLLAEEKV